MIKKDVTIPWDGNFDIVVPRDENVPRHYSFEEMNEYIDGDRWDDNMGELTTYYLLFESGMNKLKKLREKPLSDLIKKYGEKRAVGIKTGEVYNQFIHRDYSDKWASAPGTDKWKWPNEQGKN